MLLQLRYKLFFFVCVCGFWLGVVFFFFLSFAVGEVLLTDVAFISKGNSDLKIIRQLAGRLFLQAVVTANLDSLTWSQ